MSNIEQLADEYGLTVTDVSNLMDVHGYDIQEYNEQDDYMDISYDLGNALTDLMFLRDEETAVDLDDDYYDDDSENYDGECD